jgi:hypothetical protein
VSNLFLKRACAIALAWGQAASLAAQPAPEPPPIGVADSIDAIARFMVESTQGKQPTVPYPESTRPELPVAACSIELPVCVHAEGAAAADGQAWLIELEAALAMVGALGFPVPQPDAGRGGTFELDVYLSAPLLGVEPPPEGGLHGAIGSSLLDTATAYAKLDPGLPPAQRFACAVEAIAEAGLRASDPAESSLASGAVAGFVAYLATGSFGCSDRIEAVQLAPELGLAGSEIDAIATLQLALVLISRRHDGGDGEFIREVWQLSRQKSATADALRISPSFFEALDRALKNAGESFELITEEVAIARYFATRGEREGVTQALPVLPASVSVPVVAIKPFAELPAHLPVHEPLLGPLGSGYAVIETAGVPAGSRLDVWLRGDLGPRLVLTAVRLDAQGREVGRMTAPPRRLPQSFLPIELSQDTTSVLLVVTALADDLRRLGHVETEGGFGYRLILDKKKVD